MIYFQKFFARKMTGVINSIKEAFPNFEEDHLDVFSSLNSYQSDVKFQIEESANTPLPKTSRLSLLPDFFSSSTSVSPSNSPMIEKPKYCIEDVSQTDADTRRKIGFTFLADENKVMIQTNQYGLSMVFYQHKIYLFYTVSHDFIFHLLEI